MIKELTFDLKHKDVAAPVIGKGSFKLGLPNPNLQA
jgi:hypothetical protein